MALIVLNNFCLNNFFVFGLPTDSGTSIKMGQGVYMTSILSFHYVS